MPTPAEKMPPLDFDALVPKGTPGVAQNTPPPAYPRNPALSGQVTPLDSPSWAV